MRVAIIGAGYVGLVSGACLAARGHDVACVDVDSRRVDLINSGVPPIHERDLPELLRAHVGRNLRATTDIVAAVAGAELSFIAVGTPTADGRTDLGFVTQAAGQIGEVLRVAPDWRTVVVKSTVIPGTTAGLVREAMEAASGQIAGKGFGLGMNPEFLTEGTAVHDFMHPDRLVLGGFDPQTQQALLALYQDFPAHIPRVVTNTTTAEMIKYASNALLATMISFSNEFARLCSAVGDVDALDVMKGVHQSAYLTTTLSDTRITAPIAGFIEAGCGFGGSCLPKDVQALVGQGETLGLPMPLLRSVLDVNAGQADEILRLASKHFLNLTGVAVTVLGIAFKPDTDDVRESPAFPIIARLRAAGARITAFDPIARPVDHPGLTSVRLASTLEEAVEDTDVIVVTTRWAEFTALPALLKGLAKPPLVVDGRRMLRSQDLARYEGIGRA